MRLWYNAIVISHLCIVVVIVLGHNIVILVTLHLCLQMMTTVKVSNVSLGATDRDLKEFFSFSGDILYLETQRFALYSKAYIFLTLLFFSFLTLFFFFTTFVQRDRTVQIGICHFQGSTRSWNCCSSLGMFTTSHPSITSAYVFKRLMSVFTSGSNDCWFFSHCHYGSGLPTISWGFSFLGNNLTFLFTSSLAIS